MLGIMKKLKSWILSFQYHFLEIEVPYVVVREGAKVPTYATPGACGCDLYACLGEDILGNKCCMIIRPGQKIIIPTGIGVESPLGWSFQFLDRSSVANEDVHVVGGFIDCDYRNELSVILRNNSKYDYVVRDGERICQVAIYHLAHATFVPKASFSETKRGTGGFGSTGK